jgi:hypothetical protein
MVAPMTAREAEKVTPDQVHDDKYFPKVIAETSLVALEILTRLMLLLCEISSKFT